ncbi:hypothetical protein SAMN05428970_1737 [Agromyces sp. CF514]|nr:hypothetical protein SAMN05428970_1737 [Agromyces sp. CF514]
MTLQLDPALPLVWRSPDDLQLGAAEPVAVIERPGDLEHGLLSALGHGASLTTLVTIGAAFDATSDDVDRFVELVSAGLVHRHAARSAASARADATGRPTTAASTSRTVGLDGEGPLADLVAANLAMLGHEVRRLGPEPHASGVPQAARRQALGVEAEPPDPDAVVIVAAWAIAPARHLRWLRRDLPHLAVVSDDSGVRVGPLVEPGRGPCLRCLDLAARDADAAWPVIAAQLAGRPAPADTARLRFDSAALTATAVDARLAEPAGGRAHDDALGLAAASVRFDRRGSAGRRREHAQHPSCGCRAPAGIAIPHALPAADRPTAPSSARAVGVPA